MQNLLRAKYIMAFGTFDGIHLGHRFFLKNLQKFGKKIIIVIARDINVKKIKGKKPHFNEQERLNALQKIGLADVVILGDQNDFYQSIKKHQPDVIGLGYDQKANEEYLRKNFPNIKIIRMPAFQPEKYKSSILKRQM